MSRARIIEHRGRSVILIDFSGIGEPAEWNVALADARRLFATLPADRSALTLTDVSGTRYNRDTVENMKELSSTNAPFVKAGAVVNTSVMHRAVIGMIGLFAKRKFEVFETREQGLDWLVTR